MNVGDRVFFGPQTNTFTGEITSINGEEVRVNYFYKSYAVPGVALTRSRKPDAEGHAYWHCLDKDAAVEVAAQI